MIRLLRVSSNHRGNSYTGISMERSSRISKFGIFTARAASAMRDSIQPHHDLSFTAVRHFVQGTNQLGRYPYEQNRVRRLSMSRESITSIEGLWKYLQPLSHEEIKLLVLDQLDKDVKHLLKEYLSHMISQDGLLDPSKLTDHQKNCRYVLKIFDRMIDSIDPDSKNSNLESTKSVLNMITSTNQSNQMPLSVTHHSDVISSNIGLAINLDNDSIGDMVEKLEYLGLFTKLFAHVDLSTSRSLSQVDPIPSDSQNVSSGNIKLALTKISLEIFPAISKLLSTQESLVLPRSVYVPILKYFPTLKLKASYGIYKHLYSQISTILQRASDSKSIHSASIQGIESSTDSKNIIGFIIALLQCMKDSNIRDSKLINAILPLLLHQNPQSDQSKRENMSRIVELLVELKADPIMLKELLKTTSIKTKFKFRRTKAKDNLIEISSEEKEILYMQLLKRNGTFASEINKAKMLAQQSQDQGNSGTMRNSSNKIICVRYMDDLIVSLQTFGDEARFNEQYNKLITLIEENLVKSFELNSMNVATIKLESAISYLDWCGQVDRKNPGKSFIK